MPSMREYAEKCGVSYEAVRKQVNRYSAELGEHIYKVGRTQFLDDEAVAFLDAHREKSPIVILSHDKDDRIEELEAENEALKIQVMQLQGKLIERDDRIIELSDKLLALTAAPKPPADEVAPAPTPDPKQPVPEQEGKAIPWWQFWKKR